MHSLLTQVAKLDSQTGLFRPGQRLLLAISGGVDSMVLLSVCTELRYMLPFRIELQAAYVSLAPVSLPEEVIGTLTSVCCDYAVPFALIDSPAVVPEKFDCYVCARLRRRALLEYAQENGFDSIALGHNQDDYLETGLMNLIFHGSLDSLAPNQPMLGGRITIIRPLLTIPKKHILAYARQRQLFYYQHPCEYGLTNRRTRIRSLLVELTRLHRSSRANLLKAIGNWGQLGARQQGDLTG